MVFGYVIRYTCVYAPSMGCNPRVRLREDCIPNLKKAFSSSINTHTIYIYVYTENLRLIYKIKSTLKI